MSVFDWLIVAILVVLLVMLLHASDVLGNNPYRQIRDHEDLTGRFPSRMSFAEKVRWVNMFGISPTNPRRTPILALAIAALFVLLLWLQP